MEKKTVQKDEEKQAMVQVSVRLEVRLRNLYFISQEMDRKRAEVVNNMADIHV